DKLIANAVDFSSPSDPVEVRLEQNRYAITLSVINQGPLLPESMQGELFNSMVSMRKKGRTAEPHLGLGLYIARLIAEYHGGRIRAENLAGKNGVCFQLIFPAEV
ncbi:MAG: sensor histidine kinase, partial [Gammaproteobacteria bacterium]